MSDTTDTSARLIAHQIDLEKLFSKNQLIPRIRAVFQTCTVFDFQKYMEANQIPTDFGLDLLTQMALHKRANLQTLVGLLFHHFKNAQLTVDMITKAAQADLIDWSPISKVFIVKFTLSEDVQEELDRFQFPLPMVVEPKPVKSNRQNGYFVGNSSIILRDNHHEDDVCLDHINRMNSIPLTIKIETVKSINNKWKNHGKPKEGETREDFMRRKRAFEKYDRTCHDVMAIVTKEGNRFHLTHRYDKRGRTYAMGYHITTQGNSWNKAVLEFADKEIVE